jgi:2-succinyl-5-enolpyruvyl-6-hydroxy-3-cyclohexene-1-carboxylate synthase
VGFLRGLHAATVLLKYCVPVGNLSFLHDTKGLLLLHDQPQNAPLMVVLINNSGGGIFHFLPICGAVVEGELV